MVSVHRKEISMTTETNSRLYEKDFKIPKVSEDPHVRDVSDIVEELMRDLSKKTGYKMPG